MSRKYAARFIALAGLCLALAGCKDIEADMKRYIAKNRLPEAKALAVATKLASKPPIALAHSRRLLRKGSEEVRARMDEEGALFAELLKFAVDPKCSESQADGVPCTNTNMDCDSRRKVTDLIDVLRRRVSAG